MLLENITKIKKAFFSEKTQSRLDFPVIKRDFNLINSYLLEKLKTGEIDLKKYIDKLNRLALAYDILIEAPAKQPTTKQPTTKQSTTKQPTTKQSTTKQPTTKQPTTKQSTTKQSTTKQSTTKQPTTKQSTAKQPTAKQPTTKQPTTKQSTTKQPTTKQSTTKQSTAKQPTTKQSTAKQPTTKQPTAKQQSQQQQSQQQQSQQQQSQQQQSQQQQSQQQQSQQRKKSSGNNDRKNYDSILDQEVENPENAVKAARIALRKEYRLPVEVNRAWFDIEEKFKNNPARLYRELVDLIIAYKDLIPYAYTYLVSWRKTYKGEDPTPRPKEQGEYYNHFNPSSEEQREFLQSKGVDISKMPEYQQKYIASYIKTLEKLTNKQIKFI